MTDQPQTTPQERRARPVPLRILIAGLISAALAVTAAVLLATSAPPASPVSAVGPGPADADGFIGLGAATQQELGRPGGGEAHLGGRGERGGFRAITIAAKDGSSLSLQTVDGWTRTITVSSATTITKGGVAITLADLGVGDKIAFRQARNEDGTFSITAIRVLVPTAAGEVTALESGSLTLKLRDGSSRVITLTSSTKYLVGQREAARSDLSVGDRVLAQGTVSGEAFTAISVMIRPDVVAGRVTDKAGDTITIETRAGTTLTITVDAATRYRVAGATDASLDDVAVGMAIIALGLRTSETTFSAGVVGAGNRMDRGDGSRPFGRGFGPGLRGHGEMGPSGPYDKATPEPGTGGSTD